MPHDLQGFIALLEREGELKRVGAHVSTELEITEIASRQAAANGPALLFENVIDSKYPLAINLFASMRRIELGLGRHPEQIGEELLALADELLPPTPRVLWRNRNRLWNLRHLIPRHTRRPLVRQTTKTVFDLNELPVLKCWPHDGGRFITLPLVVTRTSSGDPNMGIYRMQLFDGRTTGMHFQIQKGGGFHLDQARETRQRMEVGAVLGGDLALILAAISALPEGINEMAYAGILRGHATRIFRSGKGGLPLPADVEFALEGWIDPTERRPEGPFGDHFGHYSGESPFPVFHVTRLHARHNPIYPATVVGKPPMEDRWLGDASQMIAGPLIKVMRKEIQAMWAYYEAGFHNLLVVALNARYTREAIKTAFGLLGEGQLSLTKVMILVDGDVNPRDFGAVLDALRSNYVSEENFRLLPRTAADTLDFTGDGLHRGSKMVLDATSKERLPSKPPRGGLEGLDEMGINPADRRLLRDCMLVVRVTQGGAEMARRIAQHPQLQWLKLAAVVSRDVDLHNDIELLWGIFTRFDCAQDIVFNRLEFKQIEPRYYGLLAIDATWKSKYQKPLEMPPELTAMVDRRWKEYFE